MLVTLHIVLFKKEVGEIFKSTESQLKRIDLNIIEIFEKLILP